MITAAFVLFALILGYGVAVGLLMLATFGITKAAPAFAVREHMLSYGYRVLHEVVWLVCASVGGYLAAWVAGFTPHPWFVSVLLAAILVAVLWGNTWEAAQRGLGHQMMMTAATILGVGVGFVLQLR